MATSPSMILGAALLATLSLAAGDAAADCKDGKEPTSAEACGGMASTESDILRLQAEERIKAGEHEASDGFDGSTEYEAGGTSAPGNPLETRW